MCIRDSSQGSVVHLLQPGCFVQEGWTEEATNMLLSHPDMGCVSPIVSASDNIRALLGVAYARGGARQARTFRRELIRDAAHHIDIVAPTFLAGFFCREALLEAGGWDEDIGEQLADIDIGLAMMSLGFECDVAPNSFIESDNAKGAPKGTAGFAYGVRAERLFWRHLRSHGSLLAHPLAMLQSFVVGLPMSILQVPGRLVGLLTSSRRNDHLSIDHDDVTTDSIRRAA